MSQVNTELSLSATAQISMNDTALRTLAGVPSGQISMSNLQGKSAGPTKADTTWSVVINTTTNVSTFPAGIRNGDAVFSFIFQGAQFGGSNPAFFNQPYGTPLSRYETISYNPQIRQFLHLKNQVTFIAGTNSLSGTPVGSGGTTFGLCQYVVFRRSPDFFETPALAYLGTEVTTSAYPSQAVPYTGSPSVILGMASSSRINSGNTQTCTIGGVTPTLIAKNPNTVDFCRLWYRPNITPTTLTTVGTSSSTSNIFSWRPFVVS